MKKLILIVGPFGSDQRDMAEEFANRFVSSAAAIKPYFPASSGLIQSLARQFPDEAMAIDEISLDTLPTEERQLLLDLAGQVYSYTEIRFMMSGQPPIGECQVDALLHTRAPG